MGVARAGSGAPLIRKNKRHQHGANARAALASLSRLWASSFEGGRSRDTLCSARAAPRRRVCAREKYAEPAVAKKWHSAPGLLADSLGAWRAWGKANGGMRQAARQRRRNVAWHSALSANVLGAACAKGEIGRHGGGGGEVTMAGKREDS